jgi:hypothetical protein
MSTQSNLPLRPSNVCFLRLPTLGRRTLLWPPAQIVRSSVTPIALRDLTRNRLLAFPHLSLRALSVALLVAGPDLQVLSVGACCRSGLDGASAFASCEHAATWVLGLQWAKGLNRSRGRVLRQAAVAEGNVLS